MPAGHFTKDGEDRVIATYRDGASLSQIAAEEGVCLETIRKVLRRRGVPRRSRGATARSLSADVQKKLIADYEGGMSQIPLSKKYGVSQASVSRYLRDAGVKRRLVGAALRGWNRCQGRSRMAGYAIVMVPDDSPYISMRHGDTRYILEHRLLMAQHLGRPLTCNETVHHKDGDKLNNDISNLELRQGKHGKGAHFRCAECGSHNVVPC